MSKNVSVGSTAFWSGFGFHSRPTHLKFDYNTAMERLEWSTSHAVFVPAMDEEHYDIFESLSMLRTALATDSKPSGPARAAQDLATRMEDHFAHEERIMHAARYESFDWHKKKHDAARKRVAQFVTRMNQGEPGAGPALLDYLTAWLNDHTRLADMMLGAFLRNHRRGLYRLTFSAGTKPRDACEWFDSRGEKFNPIV